MEDARNTLRAFLDQQLREARFARDVEWGDYWLKRRMVTVLMDGTEVELTPTQAKTPVRLFESFPNLIKDRPQIPSWEPPTIMPVALKDAYDHVRWDQVIRECIARLKSAREKESTNRNLSTLLAVVVKVQKDLESLVGNDWQREDANVEKQVTLDDRHSAEAL